MILTLIPQHGLPGQSETTLAVAGDVLTIDGTDYDLSAVPQGGEGVWDDSPFVGVITRQRGVIHASVLVQLGDTAAHNQTGPWVIEAEGPLTIPAERLPQPALKEEIDQWA